MKLQRCQQRNDIDVNHYTIYKNDGTSRTLNASMLVREKNSITFFGSTFELAHFPSCDVLSIYVDCGDG